MLKRPSRPTCWAERAVPGLCRKLGRDGRLDCQLILALVQCRQHLGHLRGTRGHDGVSASRGLLALVCAASTCNTCAASAGTTD